MQVTRHSYTMKYLLGLALGKWIVSHHCKSQLNLVITSAKKVSRNVRQVYLVQSKTFVSCSGNIMKVKKFYKLGAKS